MKILLYNIAYGTGNPGGELRRVLTGHHYLRAPERPFRKIGGLLSAGDPDVVCLVETDLGSLRSGNANQVELLAEKKGYHCFYAQKYAPESMLRKLPFLRHQANAILCREEPLEQRLEFFPRGTKKLILISRIGGVFFALVHLALGKKVRRLQLEYLAGILPKGEPLIVAGDFNTFGGAPELKDFLERTGLRNPNAGHHPTYPAWAPDRELDYVLLSKELNPIGFEVPHVLFSDHLPIRLEVELQDRGQQCAASGQESPIARTPFQLP